MQVASKHNITIPKGISFNKATGIAITIARLSQGFRTQAHVYRKLHMRASTYSHLELASVNISIDKIFRIATVLGTTTSAIMEVAEKVYQYSHQKE